MCSLTDLMVTRLHRGGFCQVRYSAKRDLAALGRELGTPIPSRPSGPDVDRLVPNQPDQAPARSLSARYGVGEFPFHSDCAYYKILPRWVLLRLAAGSASVSRLN